MLVKRILWSFLVVTSASQGQTAHPRIEAAAAIYILGRAACGLPVDTAAWNSFPASSLTREWAKWNGQPDPILYMQRAISMRQDMDSIARAAKRLIGTLSGADSTVSDSILRQVDSYLPRGTPVRGRVLLTAFIP